MSGCDCGLQVVLDECINENKIGYQSLRQYESQIEQMRISIDERDDIIDQCNTRGNDVINQLQTYQLLMREQEELVEKHVKYSKELEAKLDLCAQKAGEAEIEARQEAAREEARRREVAREARRREERAREARRREEARRQEEAREARRREEARQARQCPSSQIPQSEIRSKCRNASQYKQIIKMIHPDKNRGCIAESTMKTKLCNDVRIPN